MRFFDVLRLLLTWGLTFLSLLLTAKLLPGFTYTSWLPLAAAAAVAGVVGMIVRPVLVEVAAAIGWLAVAAATLFGQAIVMQIAMDIVPGASFDSFGTAVAAAWLTAAFSTLLVWLVSAGTDESFAASLLRIKPGKVSDPDVDGVVFVQLDGVSFPVMQWVLQSGTMPTLRRWLDTGSHAVHEWTVQLPCTTPASQQAILQGHADGIPAFRWYDRDLGRVLVANRPDDASIIESRASTGRGLLADDGVSVSNLFTGDAAKASMTMSRLEVTRGSRRTRQVFGRFLIRPDGLVRSISRTIAEMVRERFQATRQRRLEVHPRVHRSWTFAGLRAFSNCLLRDLNTAVVAEEMMRGARSIYVDYVDYDEIGHHAGATRIESLAALGGLDQVVAILEKVAQRAPRTYHLVLLSDHGQSQGEPFAARYGIDLSDLCRSLTDSQTTGIEGSIEGWGWVDSVLEDLGGTRTDRRAAGGLAAGRQGPQAGGLRRGGGRADRARRRQPGDGLRPWPRAAPARGDRGPVARADPGARRPPRGRVRQRPEQHRAGRHRGARSPGPLDRCGRGRRPAAPFGDHAPAMLATATLMDRAPELYVNSSSTSTRWTWRPSNPSWDAMVVSVGGRTADSCWHHHTCSPRPSRSWAATSCTSTSWACSRRWGTGLNCRGAPRESARE